MGSILGSPCFGELPYRDDIAECRDCKNFSGDSSNPKP